MQRFPSRIAIRQLQRRRSRDLAQPHASEMKLEAFFQVSTSYQAMSEVAQRCTRGVR